MIRLIPLILLLSIPAVGCHYDYSEANLKRYREYIATYSAWKDPAASSAEKYENTFNNGKWNLIWSDEFDYEGLPDNSKWDYDEGGSGWGNNERQYYTKTRAENARVENGVLIIEARNDGVFGPTSGRLTTRGKSDWKHVKIDIKAKMPSGRGVWPAIWMMPSGHSSWLGCGEIDIIETVGFNPDWAHFSIHTGAFNHKIGTQKSTFTDIKSLSGTFHIYSIEWSQDRIVMLLDGIPYFDYPRNGSNDPAIWPFDKNYYLIMNIAVGGTWGGVFGVDDSIFPQRLVVDYVRVYKPANPNPQQ